MLGQGRKEGCSETGRLVTPVGIEYHGFAHCIHGLDQSLESSELFRSVPTHHQINKDSQCLFSPLMPKLATL
jgi:hypothetical protein